MCAHPVPAAGSNPAYEVVPSTEPVPGGAQLRLVADLIPELAWLAAPDGALDYLNRPARAYTGQGAQRPGGAGEGWSALIHPDDVDHARQAWVEAVRVGTLPEHDCRLRRADGQFRWHRVRGVPVCAADGRPAGWVCTGTDVDAERALRDQLRQAERENSDTRAVLEALQSAAPIGFGFGDREFRFLRVNETLARINGVPVEQHVGRHIAEVVPAVWPLIEPAYRRVLETGEAVLRTDVTVPSDSSLPRSWIATYYPIRVDGTVVAVGFIVVDVTDHRQALQFRSVGMENMAEGLFTTDDQGRITSVNRAATNMLGWAEMELLGRSVHDIVRPPPADSTAGPAADCPLLRVRTEGQQVAATDGTYVHKDGSTVPVMYSAAPLHLGSTVAGVVVVFRDGSVLRRQQRREVEARHDQKMESLGRLSAGLAHEINTPIQFVGDNTRFLAEAYEQMLELLLVYRDCMGPSSGQLSWAERNQRAEEAEAKADIEYLAAEVPAAVGQSLEGVERVASLVRAMKAFSYKDSKEHAYADLNEAIRTTVTVARNEVKYVADVALDLGELPEVLCHLGDLNQVFLNLLVNAADAMQDKGERGEIRITTRVDGGFAVIRFADNGPGIPEHLQQAIFEPFFTTKEVGKGTGQGLALAQAVCEKHGGTITVDSRVGSGTEFVLRLPVAGKRGVPKETPA